MLIQYCSDIHLEFVQNRLFLDKNPIKPIGEILVLAGDITYWGKKHFKYSFFDYISEHFKAVYYVPGNHEFYSGKDLRLLDNEVYEPIRDNVFLVNNKVVTLDDVGLFFSTLWSEIPISKSLIVESNINDFHKIKYRSKKLNTNIFNALHKVSLQFLSSAITSSKMNKKVILVTMYQVYYAILISTKIQILVRHLYLNSFH
ncbi:metallophosphoesterase [Saccharicrinis aurantiacus]|uniref:metallophosphoesterase n=1 Tax=Saccharicrinis aurantiacus TaxID=1849719 RepID=UPI0009F9DA99|nr:metallophosphoesterase [Saccharicrinis aurantiacus]